jgi:hypothetical protein
MSRPTGLCSGFDRFASQPNQFAQPASAGVFAQRFMPAPAATVPAPIYYVRPAGWKEHREHGLWSQLQPRYERDDDDDGARKH